MEHHIQLAEHNAAVTANQNLLSLLGDFWFDYYSDYATLKSLTASLEALFSGKFKDVLRLVLSANISEIPQTSNLDFSVLLLESTKATIKLTPEGDFEHIEYSLDILNDSKSIQNVQYISSNILNPRFTLRRSEDFLVANNKLYLYKNVFTDTDILENTLNFELHGNKTVFLWGVDCTIETYNQYNRFGYFSYNSDRTPDSVSFKNFVHALHHFFVNKKSIFNLSAILNILSGIPYSSIPGETITDIKIVVDGGIEEAAPVLGNKSGIKSGLADTQEEIASSKIEYLILTDQGNSYYVPYHGDLNYYPGQVLDSYKPLVTLYTAKDYISDPEWHYHSKFPAELLVSLDWSNFPPNLKEHYQKLSFYYYNSGSNHSGNIFYGSPFSMLRAKSNDLGGNELEVFLFELMDEVLRFNLVHLSGQANYEEYNKYKAYLSEVKSLYELVKPGFPVHLYPIFEFLIDADFADKADLPETSELYKANIGSQHPEHFYSQCLRYDGKEDHSVEFLLFHNNQALYNSVKTYHEVIQKKYSCVEYTDYHRIEPFTIQISEICELSPNLPVAPESLDIEEITRQHEIITIDHNGLAFHNNLVFYGNTPIYWNDFGHPNLADVVNLNLETELAFLVIHETDGVVGIYD